MSRSNPFEQAIGRYCSCGHSPREHGPSGGKPGTSCCQCPCPRFTSGAETNEVLMADWLAERRKEAASES